MTSLTTYPRLDLNKKVANITSWPSSRIASQSVLFVAHSKARCASIVAAAVGKSYELYNAVGVLLFLTLRVTIELQDGTVDFGSTVVKRGTPTE